MLTTELLRESDEATRETRLGALDNDTKKGQRLLKESQTDSLKPVTPAVGEKFDYQKASQEAQRLNREQALKDLAGFETIISHLPATQATQSLVEDLIAIRLNRVTEDGDKAKLATPETISALIILSRSYQTVGEIQTVINPTPKEEQTPPVEVETNDEPDLVVTEKDGSLEIKVQGYTSAQLEGAKITVRSHKLVPLDENGGFRQVVVEATNDGLFIAPLGGLDITKGWVTIGLQVGPKRKLVKTHMFKENFSVLSSNGASGQPAQ